MLTRILLRRPSLWSLRKPLVLAALLFSGAAELYGGGETYAFLRNDVGARAAALGGSFITGVDDPNLIFYNPAGLGSLGSRRISFGFFKHLLDINSGYASFGTEVPGFGFVGAGVVYINYGDFRRTDEDGQDLGTFGAGEFAASVAYAGELHPQVVYGVGAKFIYSSIAEYHSSGAALDFGLQYLVNRQLILGASVLNLGTQIDPYITTKEDLPLDVRAGISIYPEHLPAVVMISITKLNEDQDKFFDRLRAFAVGVEFSASSNVQLRAGYNNEKRRELKLGASSGLAGLSLGGGITFGTYTLDYSYNSYGEIGALHRVSLGLAL